MDINNFIKVELIQDDEEKVDFIENNTTFVDVDSFADRAPVSETSQAVHDERVAEYDASEVNNDQYATADNELPSALKNNLIYSAKSLSGSSESRKVPPLKIYKMKKSISTKDCTAKEKKNNSNKEKKFVVACGCCSEEFAGIKAYRKHFSVNHSSETIYFKCPLCSKSFQLQRLLQNHRRSCFSKCGSLEKCPMCDKLFASKHLLKKHAIIHSDEKPHQCADCSKSFRTKSDLKTHSVVHLPLEMRETHMCEQCGRSFTLRRNFLTHLKMHLDPQIFICELCGHTFKTKGNLKSHMVHHTGERNHSCTLCEKSFASKAYLKVHILLHSNIKLHKCDICGKDFARRSILTKHMYVHNGIRPYPCKFCNKAFRAKDKLVVHERIHTGEKPYRCEFCPGAFCESGNLQKHKKNVHKYILMQTETAVSTSSTADIKLPNNNGSMSEPLCGESSASFGEGLADTSPILFTQLTEKVEEMKKNFEKQSLTPTSLAQCDMATDMSPYVSYTDISRNNSETNANQPFIAALQ